MPHPKSNLHLVKEGDSLSSIAAYHYGDPSLWPHIARANRIPNHGQIVVGMKLNLPTIPSSTPPADRVQQIASNMRIADPGSPNAMYLEMPSLHYKFEKGMSISPDGPVDIAVTLTGEIILTKTGKPSPAEIDYAFLHNGRVQPEVSAEYHAQFGQLTTDMSVTYDSSKATLTGGFALSRTIGHITFHEQWFPGPYLIGELTKPVTVKGETSDKKWKWSGEFNVEVKIEGTPPNKVFPYPQFNLQKNPVTVRLIPAGNPLAGLLHFIDDLIGAGALVVLIFYSGVQAAAPVVAMAAAVRTNTLSYSSAAALYNWPPQRI